MTSRYHVHVDPSAANNSHAYALELVGWNRRVLELGAASGHMTRALADQRCRVTAVEYEAPSAEELVGIADEVVAGDLNDPQVFAGLRPEFDTVLAGDVLEHLLRPQDVLSRAAQLLKPGGQVVVSVPHVAHVDVRLSLLQGAWDYRAWGLLDDTHTRFFTLKSIKAMVKEAGLVITDLRRVRVPAFETELALAREQFPNGVLDHALRDPEAETYQFVFSATVDDGDYRLRRLAERNLELESELDRVRVSDRVHEITNENLAAESRRLAEQARDRERAMADLEAQLEASRRVIARVEGSVSWKLFQRSRIGLFALVGGERSPAVRALQAMLRGLGRRLDGGA